MRIKVYPPTEDEFDIGITIVQRASTVQVELRRMDGTTPPAPVIGMFSLDDENLIMFTRVGHPNEDYVLLGSDGAIRTVRS